MKMVRCYIMQSILISSVANGVANTCIVLPKTYENAVLYGEIWCNFAILSVSYCQDFRNSCIVLHY
jgi:hypothetical protein